MLPSPVGGTTVAMESGIGDPIVAVTRRIA
jgi:hypothetical protein